MKVNGPGLAALLLGASTALLFAWGCQTNAAPSHKKEAASQPAKTAASSPAPSAASSNTEGTPVFGSMGEELFYSNCAACHLHKARLGPRLKIAADYLVKAGVPGEALGKLLMHAVRKDRANSPMPHFSEDELSDADVGEIGRYIGGFTSPGETVPELGSAERGRPIYEESCGLCHGTHGEGVGTMLPLAGLTAEFKQAGVPGSGMLGIVRYASRTGDIKGMIEYTQEDLSDQDLADIAAYIWSMEPLDSSEGE
jgi:mono/diheme cytochrome c family protein